MPAKHSNVISLVEIQILMLASTFDLLIEHTSHVLPMNDSRISEKVFQHQISNVRAHVKSTFTERFPARKSYCTGTVNYVILCNILHGNITPYTITNSICSTTYVLTTVVNFKNIVKKWRIRFIHYCFSRWWPFFRRK